LSDTKTEIKFHSIARNGNGEIVEDMIWRVVVEYEIYQIGTYSPPGSRFNFAVTDDQLQLLEDKKRNNMKNPLTFIALLFFSLNPFAVRESRPTPIDSRIRVMVYNPNDVFKFTGYFIMVIKQL
jgi:hypothetical protein